MDDTTNRYRIALMIVSGVLAATAVAIIVILFLPNQGAQDDIAALEQQVAGLKVTKAGLEIDVEDLQESNEEMQSTNDELSEQLTARDAELFAATSATTSTTTTTRVRTYSVEVVYDGRLNVRTGPGTEYPKIGFLAPDAVCVPGTGNNAVDSEGRLWVEIQYEAGIGWVAEWFVTEAPC